MLLLGGLAVTTVAVVTGQADRYVDVPVQDFVAAHDWRVPHRLLEGAVRAGDGDVVVATVSAAAVACVVLGRPWNRVLRLVVGCAASGLLIQLLKVTFDRTSSYTIPGQAAPRSGAYPSGHVAAVLIVTGLVVWALAPGNRRVARSWAVVLAASASAVEGAAILLLHQHWLTDIAAGWLLGLLLLLAFTTERTTERRHRTDLHDLGTATRRPLAAAPPGRNEGNRLT